MGKRLLSDQGSPKFNKLLHPLHYNRPTVPATLSSYLPQDADWSSTL